jgi:hypothetical protein
MFLQLWMLLVTGIMLLWFFYVWSEACTDRSPIDGRCGVERRAQLFVFQWLA